MKIRYLVVLLVILIIGGCVSANTFISKDEYRSIDMGDINDRFENVISQFDVSKTELSDDMRTKLQQQYDCYIYMSSDDTYQENVNNAVNEQKVLIDYTVGDKLIAKVVFDGQRQKVDKMYDKLHSRIVIILGIISSVMFLILVVIYMSYIYPFRKLQNFANQIAKGNLNIPLKMPRRNYFGAFTESFDIMREELARARQGEYEANKSKKELVAELSHDIKTPVSTIKAICEILPLQTDDQNVQNKVNIITQKTDVIDSLITDMFHATLQDLQVLKVEPKEELSTIIRPMLSQLDYMKKIHIVSEIPECLIYVDKLRINQVIDNVISNSYKYADTDIEISSDAGIYEGITGIRMIIRDHGQGVSEEELPLITEKFYRGGNTAGKEGSGLGLYLSALFMDKMGGCFKCYNDNGFVVELIMKKVIN